MSRGLSGSSGLGGAWDGKIQNLHFYRLDMLNFNKYWHNALYNDGQKTWFDKMSLEIFT